MNDHYVHLSGKSGLTKEQVLDHISNALSVEKQLMDSKSRIDLRVTAWGWNMLDSEWPGGNDRKWFYVTNMTVSKTDTMNVFLLNVQVGLDNGH